MTNHLARFPDPLAFAFSKSGLGNLATDHQAGLHWTCSVYYFQYYQVATLAYMTVSILRNNRWETINWLPSLCFAGETQSQSTWLTGERTLLQKKLLIAMKKVRCLYQGLVWPRRTRLASLNRGRAAWTYQGREKQVGTMSDRLPWGSGILKSKWKSQSRNSKVLNQNYAFRHICIS